MDVLTDTADSSAMTFAAEIATFVIGLSWDDLPASVRASAKEHALDALGTALAATGMDFGEAIHRAGVRLGTSTASRTLGFGTALPEASAALVNGTLMHGLDFDDTHIGAIYHATAPALAAALAVGEAEKADGESVLLAYVIGLEVGCRLAAAGAGLFHARSFHPTGIAGTFAAACVAAKLRGASVATLTSALGLCGSQAAGILQLQDSWLKRMHPGWAAHSGIIALTMAEEGFLGPATVLEGGHGLYASHLGKIPTRAELGLDDLGKRWMTSEIALKPYPCCHFTHAFADAAFALLDELGVQTLSSQDIVSISCPTTPAMMPAVTEPAWIKIAPTSIYDALFSVQYVVARALVTRRVDLAAFYDEKLDDPAVLKVAGKISCPPAAANDFPAHFSGEVIIHLADGRTVGRKVAASYGTQEHPMTAEDVQRKFTSNAQRVLTVEQAQRLTDIVGQLESLTDISALLDACVAPAGVLAMADQARTHTA